MSQESDRADKFGKKNSLHLHFTIWFVRITPNYSPKNVDFLTKIQYRKFDNIKENQDVKLFFNMSINITKLILTMNFM